MPRIQRKDAERLLASVPEEQVFQCCDGRVLRNLKELMKAFHDMADDAFAYHSNEERNDFSNWVRFTIGDQKLAGDLEKSYDRGQAAKRVADRIDFLSGKLA